MELVEGGCLLTLYAREAAAATGGRVAAGPAGGVWWPQVPRPGGPRAGLLFRPSLPVSRSGPGDCRSGPALSRGGGEPGGPFRLLRGERFAARVMRSESS